MHDIKAIRADPDLFKKQMALRRVNPLVVDFILAFDTEARDWREAADYSQVIHKEMSEVIHGLKRDGFDIHPLGAWAAEQRRLLAWKRGHEERATASRNDLLASLPNVMDSDVPSALSA